jgi:type II secretory ATPase GspE/PulE/Tfp pilus assembly ATPase PilB-like protein
LRVESSLRAEKTLTGEECRELIGLAKRRGRLDPAVSDRAQAGWFEWNEHVVRVSTCPYAPGEGLVLRIIDATPREVRLEETGMTKSAAAAVRSWLADGHGLVLVAGPRTSGRRSTLAALLSELDRERGKVSTIEETPAVAVPGVSRVRLRPGEGFDRAAGLRAQLEQDLDAVCVPDIAEPEAIRVAVAAALTGHLVLASIDARETLDALVRLMEAGVDPRAIAETVRGVAAQRLLRTGTGRVAVYEILSMSPRIRGELRQEPTIENLRRAALADGLVPLTEAARELVEQGLIAPDEVERVLGGR